MKRETLLLALTAFVAAACAALAGCQAAAGRDDVGFCPAYLDLLGTNPVYCRDTIRAAKALGVDYRKLIDSCIARDKPSMHNLFWLSSAEGVEGGCAAEGHGCFVGFVLSRTGDAFFAECLAKESRGIQESVRQTLVCAAGYGPGKEDQVMNWLRKTYPQVFAEHWKPE